MYNYGKNVAIYLRNVFKKNMNLQSCIWEYPAILLYRSSYICEVGNRDYDVSSELFVLFQVKVVPGSHRDIQSCPCVILAVCSRSLSCVKGRLHPRLKSLSTLDQDTIKIHCWGWDWQVMSFAWSPPNITSKMNAMKFNKGFIRPENVVSHSMGVIAVVSQTTAGIF